MARLLKSFLLYWPSFFFSSRSRLRALFLALSTLDRLHIKLSHQHLFILITQISITLGCSKRNHRWDLSSCLRAGGHFWGLATLFGKTARIDSSSTTYVPFSFSHRIVLPLSKIWHLLLDNHTVVTKLLLVRLGTDRLFESVSRCLLYVWLCHQYLTLVTIIVIFKRNNS